MSNLVDTRHARARIVAEEESRRPSGRSDEVITFAVVAFTLVLIAVFVTAALRNAPTSAADSDASAMYGLDPHVLTARFPPPFGSAVGATRRPVRSGA
jgi:hypothetical protein